jgi:glycosyltransferase involved in cell wall biosynthesis
VQPERLGEAGDAFEQLLTAFRERYGQARPVAEAAARSLARAGHLRRALALDPALPIRLPQSKARREARRRRAIRDVRPLLARVESDAVRVAVVAPEPTPYRAPVFDLLAARPEINLTVVYSGRSLMWRSWQVELHHTAVFLEGLRIPGARRIVHHEFPVTPGIVGALARARPDVAVVVGWSTFASQTAIVWCRARGVPYILEVDSHDEGPRAGWRRSLKRSVVPWLVRGAASVLVTGTLVSRSLLTYGAAPDRMRLFPVTIDAAAFGKQADGLRGRREELRRTLGIEPDDVAVLSVARLSPEKGLDTLLRAAAAAANPRLVVMIAGSGPERLRLHELARSLGIRLLLLDERPWERMVEVYAVADVFCLLSLREPWGVVVNEAAACGLPLVLSERVGAAADLLRDGQNGALVPAGDVQAAAAALSQLASSAAVRSAAGERSRELMREWGYGPGVERFVEAVREAATSR